MSSTGVVDYVPGIIHILIVLLGSFATLFFYFCHSGRKGEQPVQTHFINCNQRRCRYKYLLTFRFGCPSYNFGHSNILINYRLLNDDFSVSTEGKLRGSNISSKKISEQTIAVGRATPFTEENLASLRIWLESKAGWKADTGRLYLYSIGKMNVSGDDKTSIVEYPFNKWITKKGFTDPFTTVKENVEKPLASLPPLTKEEVCLISMTTASVIGLTCMCIMSGIKLVSFVESIVIFIIGILVGVFVHSVLITIYRYQIKRRQVVSRFIKLTEDKKIDNIKYAFQFGLVATSVFFGTVSTIVGFNLSPKSVLAWVIVTLLAIAAVLGGRYVAWKRNLWIMLSRKLWLRKKPKQLPKSVEFTSGTFSLEILSLKDSGSRSSTSKNEDLE